MSGERRDWVEAVVKLAAVAVMLVPLLPDARTRWWCAMRLSQNAARHFGLLAIAAESKYREEVS